MRGSDDDDDPRATRTPADCRPRLASCRDTERKGKVLGLESPSYGITNRRAGYGSTRVRGSDDADDPRAATHTRGLPSAARLMPGHRTQREGARAGKHELRNHKQASRVRKYPGAGQLRRHPRGYTHTRGLPSAARLMPGHRTQREGARAGKPELRNHKQASRVRKYPGAGQRRRRRPKGCYAHPRTAVRGSPHAGTPNAKRRCSGWKARATEEQPSTRKKLCSSVAENPFVSIRGSKQPRFRQSLRDVAWNFPEFLT